MTLVDMKLIKIIAGFIVTMSQQLIQTMMYSVHQF